ncbi:Hypothetical predicted protein [Podarcis lilfordi]|nr:Hypothetical predicted protein [Podarcis lilfordi]
MEVRSWWQTEKKEWDRAVPLCRVYCSRIGSPVSHLQEGKARNASGWGSVVCKTTEPVTTTGWSWRQISWSHRADMEAS